MKITTSIFELTLGSPGTILGYNRAYGGYTGKLMAKGLVPGTSFVVLNLALAEGAVQIMLKEKIIVLSKPEANALCLNSGNNHRTY